MPELIAERVEAAVIVTRSEFVAQVEVGNVGDARVLQPMPAARIARLCDGSEPLSERKELVVVEPLALHDQNSISVNCSIQLRERRVIERRRQVDGFDPANEKRMQLLDPDCHRRAPRGGSGFDCDTQV